jgi:hypothetical protein
MAFGIESPGSRSSEAKRRVAANVNSCILLCLKIDVNSLYSSSDMLIGPHPARVILYCAFSSLANFNTTFTMISLYPKYLLTLHHSSTSSL